MSTNDKMIRYRLPGDKLIRTCSEKLTKTTAWRIQGAIILPDVQPVQISKLPEVLEYREEVASEEVVKPVVRRGRKPKNA
jgi:hypothetical protein